MDQKQTVVNWVVATQIVRCFCRSVALANYYPKVQPRPLGIGPEIVTVDVNWPSVRSYVEGHSKVLLAQLKQLSDNEIAAKLEFWRGRTRDLERGFAWRQADATKRTADNLATAVAWADKGIEIARTIRDLSATFVVVGSAFVSGGASLPVLGAGSALKGAFKYQDTQDVGQAAFETVSTFAISVIELPAAANVAKKIPGGKQVVAFVLASVDGVFEAAKTLAEPDHSLNKAVMAGLSKTALDLVSDELMNGLKRSAVPVSLKTWRFPRRSPFGAALKDTAEDWAVNGMKNFASHPANCYGGIADALAHCPEHPTDRQYVREAAMRQARAQAIGGYRAAR